MAVNNISYSIYLLLTNIENGYTTKIIPFFFLFSIGIANSISFGNSQNNMEDSRLISHGLYRVVGEKLGTEKVVDMRRRVMALEQSLKTASCTDDDPSEDEILSGSRCEGFRFTSSDEDWMFIYRGIRVIFCLPTEGQYYEKRTLLMAERDTTKPGFSLLRLLHNSAYPADPCVTQSCLPYRDGYYVASQKWRDYMTSLDPDLTTHGPCSTTFQGTTEVDLAFCFKSEQISQKRPTVL